VKVNSSYLLIAHRAEILNKILDSHFELHNQIKERQIIFSTGGGVKEGCKFITRYYDPRKLEILCI
jgi:hypothetical protein